MTTVARDEGHATALIAEWVEECRQGRSDREAEAIGLAKRRWISSRSKPNGCGKFISEQDAVDWINAHPRLTKAEDTIDEPLHSR
jgi:hypothetical protein